MARHGWMLIALAAAASAAAAAPGQVEAPIPAIGSPGYDEKRIGAWVVRTDRQARYGGRDAPGPGVIEMAAESGDGRLQWHVRDNGDVLQMELEVDGCGTTRRMADYARLLDFADAESAAWRDFSNSCRQGREFSRAQGAPTREERSAPPRLAETIRDFPAAVEELKARATALWGPGLARCTLAPGLAMELHPPCPWPPEIGQRPRPRPVTTAQDEPRAPGPAADPEGWTCMQQAYDGGLPARLELLVEGDILRDLNFNLPYRIVHNTADELIATYPSVGDNGIRRAVDARTIVIDKRSGNMIASNIDLWASADENRPVTGQCERRPLESD